MKKNHLFGHYSGNVWKKIVRGMKLTAILFFLAMFSVAAEGLGQGGAISMKMEGATLKEIFQELKLQSEYTFVYSEQSVSGIKVDFLDVKNANLDQVLSECLKDTKLEYYVENNVVVIRTKTPKPIQQQQEKKEVTGRVTDEEGEPLVGATVWEKGTGQGTVSDFNGNYFIKASKGSTLVFSFIGLQTKEVLIENQSVIDVFMKRDITSLSEVQVVSTGYQKVSKERVTGSYSTISPQEVEAVSSVNILERLEGVTAGVDFDIKNNNIYIHGVNSYSASQPLIVIDGFPMPEEDFSLTKDKSFQGSSTLSYLNPEDIESITILKDAAAASIWGSRAANGVIVINTKKGKSSEPTVNLSMTFNMGDKPYLSKLKQMSSAEYISFEKELFDKGFLVDNTSYWSNSSISDAQEAMFSYERGTSTEEEMNSALDELSGRNNQSQIKKYLLQNSISQQYNMSISGGSDKNTYFISANYTNDQPVMKSNESESYSFTFNNTVKLFTDHINLKTGINYLKSDYKVNTTAYQALSTPGTIYSPSSGLRPYDMIVDENGEGIDKYLMFRPEVIQNFENEGYLPWTYNYIDELNKSNTITKADNIRLNASMDGNVTDWLNLEVSGNYFKKTSELNTLNEADSYVTRTMLNVATSYADGDIVNGIPLGGYLVTQNVLFDSYSLRGQFNINKAFGKKHYLNMIGGAEIREENRKSYNQSRYGYNENTNTSKVINPTVYYTTVYGWSSYVGYSDGTVSKFRNRYLSYYSSGSYSYLDRYYLSGSIRFDDFNLLGASRHDRALPLWSVGLKWDMAKENFMRQFSWLDYLNIRTTYGKAGTSPSGGIGNSSAIINVGANDYYTDLPLTYISSPENKNLKWETTATINAGVDFSTFNRRLFGSFDVYFKKTNDILANMPYNPTYGWASLQYNAGTLKGHGIDLSLTGQIIDSRKFQWSSTLNVAYNTNEVTDSRFDATTLSDYTGSSPMAGKPLDYIYAYKWAGLDADGQSQIYDENGDIVNKDVYTTALNPKVMKYMGRTTAPYFGGFLNDFAYKNFSLGIQMTFYFGHVFRKPTLNNYPSYVGTFYNSIGRDKQIATRWQEAGDEEKTNVPGLANINYSSLSRFNYADINVLPADNIRLKMISLSYRLPEEVLQSIFVKNVKFSLEVRNLGLLWKKNKEGYDPQYLSTARYSTLAPSRNYSFRLSMSF